MADKPLRVGSWPGYIATQNQFLELFLDGIAAASPEIISFDDVEAIDAASPEVDVLLLHWPQRVFWEADGRLDVLVKMARLLRGLRRRRQTKVVWVAHDLVPHDAAGLQRWLWPSFMRALLAMVDGYLTLSLRTVEAVATAYPELGDRPALGLRHPVYPDQMLSASDRQRARRHYGFTDDELVLAYCGQIRHNKGVDHLARAFEQWDNPHARLLVAGMPAGNGVGLVPELEALARRDGRVRLDLRHLEAEEFRSAVGACDVFVAPFRHYLHSGSLLHALSSGRPVLTSQTPFSLDLSEKLGTEWVRLVSGELDHRDLSEALRLPLPSGEPDLAAFEADAVGRETARWLTDLAAAAS